MSMSARWAPRHRGRTNDSRMANLSRRGIGAGEGNRTLVVSLGSFCSTIELHPQSILNQSLRSLLSWSWHRFGTDFLQFGNLSVDRRGCKGVGWASHSPDRKLF